MKNSFGNNLPIVNLYKNKSLKSGIDTQLLYGDNFRVIKKHSGWKKIRIKKDGYIGYIKKKNFSQPIKPNFKVSVLKASLFSKPNPKKKLKQFLPYESRLRIVKKNGKFAKFENHWIKISDLKKSSNSSSAIIKKMIDKGIFHQSYIQVDRIQNNSINSNQKNKLSSDQNRAYDQIKESFIKNNIVLFNGITSSGKTEIYINKNYKIIHKK